MASKSTTNITARYPSVIDGNNGSAVKKLRMATMNDIGHNNRQSKIPGITKKVTNEHNKISTKTLSSSSTNVTKKRKSDEKFENSLTKKHKLQHNGQQVGTSVKKPLADITGKHTSATNSSSTASKPPINSTSQKASSALALKSSKVFGTSGSRHPPIPSLNSEPKLTESGISSFSMKPLTLKALDTASVSAKSRQTPLVSKTVQVMPLSTSRSNVIKHSSNDESTTTVVKTSTDAPIKDEIQASTSAAMDTVSFAEQVPDGKNVSNIANNGSSSMSLVKDDSLVELLKKTIHEQESLLQQQMTEINTLKQAEFEMKTKLLGMEEELNQLKKCCRCDDELNNKSTPVEQKQLQQQASKNDGTTAHKSDAVLPVSEEEKIGNENGCNNVHTSDDNLILTNSLPKLTNLVVVDGASFSADIVEVVENAILKTCDGGKNVLVGSNIITENSHSPDAYVKNNEEVGIADKIQQPEDDRNPTNNESIPIAVGLKSFEVVHQVSSSTTNTVVDTPTLESYSASRVVVDPSADSSCNGCDHELRHSSTATKTDTGTISLTTTTTSITKPFIAPLNMLSVVKAEETIDFENSKLFSDDETAAPQHGSNSSAVKCRRTPIKTRPKKRALRKQQQQQQQETTNESENIKEE